MYYITTTPAVAQPCASSHIYVCIHIYICEHIHIFTYAYTYTYMTTTPAVAQPCACLDRVCKYISQRTIFYQ